jgi:hypothetical protein
LPISQKKTAAAPAFNAEKYAIGFQFTKNAWQ